MKKIAAEMREYHGLSSKIDKWADALDALAAQSQEPVSSGWRLVPQRFVGHVLALEHNWTKLTPIPPEFCCGPDSEHWFKEAYRRCGKDLSAAKEMLDAGPQPSPPQTAVPEEFERALKEARDLADQHWQPGKYKDEAFAKLARLYALASAAPQPVTVSREGLLEAFMIYADPKMVRVTYNVEKLRALGIEVKE